MEYLDNHPHRPGHRATRRIFWNRRWPVLWHGYDGGGGLGLVIIILLVLLVMGRL